MKIAIIGSRGINNINIGDYIPKDVTEIVSGGACGVDSMAKEYAFSNAIKYTEFLPEYEKYKKGAPLKRNLQIIDYADMIIALWDGMSKGTKFVIDNCEKKNKKIRIVII